MECSQELFVKKTIGIYTTQRELFTFKRIEGKTDFSVNINRAYCSNFFNNMLPFLKASTKKDQEMQGV